LNVLQEKYQPHLQIIGFPCNQFWLSVCPPPVTAFKPISIISYDGLSSNDLRWNFDKFLINKNGEPVKRYTKEINPLVMEDDIIAEING